MWFLSPEPQPSLLLLFVFFVSFVEKQSGTEAAKELIVATTDKNKGALRKVANEIGYRTLPIGDDVGGRYSVFVGGRTSTDCLCGN